MHDHDRRMSILEASVVNSREEVVTGNDICNTPIYY